MAHEITPWKEPGCDLGVEVGSVSARETFSREINKQYGGGGGLNANYQTMEAGVIVSNVLGKHGMEYSKDFILKTAGGVVLLDFCSEKRKNLAAKILELYGYVVHS